MRLRWSHGRRRDRTRAAVCMDRSRLYPLWYFGTSRNELVAQSVEQRTFNAWVVGSIPTELTTFRSYRATGWRALTARDAPYR